MHRFIKRSLSLLFLFGACLANAASPEEIQIAVWVNEAIIATNTYNYSNFMARQLQIAKYFSTQGWINYSKVFNESGLPKTVQNKRFEVTAVALLPPEVKTVSKKQWQATMPIMVVYSNPQQKQKQTLSITIDFVSTENGEGVRGLAINSFQSKTTNPPCECKPLETSP